jgi:hypothetical protein
MDLQEIAKEINGLLEKRRKELSLTFIEEEHVYYMKDTNGVIKNTFPSVSKVIKKFYKPFDADGMSLRMCKGNREVAAQLREEWNRTGTYATNMGSRVHFVLESDTIGRFGNYKEVRQPIFECDETQLIRSDHMIKAGKKFLDLMIERGAILLDTEIVLGDNELGYTGQPDKVWLMLNKDKTDFGIVITDWKGLPIDTPILTNSGWKNMGELTINDKVFDKDGNLVNIKNFSKVKNIKCLKISFDNGEEIVADFEHRWLVYTKHNNIVKEFVMTTQEIKDYYDSLSDRRSHQILKIKNTKPLQLPKRELPIDPYLMGIWLGDGQSLTQENEKIWEEFKNRGYTIGGTSLGNTNPMFNVRSVLNNLNLKNDKHLPDEYLLSSYEQRLDLLRGLMDSDGYFNKKRNRFSISTTKLDHVEFSVKIISSLGLKPTVITNNKKQNGETFKCYNIEFTTNSFNPFLCRNQDIDTSTLKDKHSFRNVTSVIDCDSVPTRCIEVDSPTNTFLFSHSLIVTHNTNQPKNFEVQHYTGKLYAPFNEYHDTALSHYFLQLPFYGKLLLKMLKGTKYQDIKLLGSVIVLLKDDGTFMEYKVPPRVNNLVLNLDIKKYI